MAEKITKSKTASKTAGKKAPAKAPSKASASKSAAKPIKKKTTFTLRAPDASQVNIAGCFNEWSATADALMLGDEGIWTCTLMLEPGEHEYRFVVDGMWCDDPMADMRRANEFGCENCIIIV